MANALAGHRALLASIVVVSGDGRVGGRDRQLGNFTELQELSSVLARAQDMTIYLPHAI